MMKLSVQQVIICFIHNEHHVQKTYRIFSSVLEPSNNTYVPYEGIFTHSVSKHLCCKIQTKSFEGIMEIILVQVSPFDCYCRQSLLLLRTCSSVHNGSQTFDQTCHCCEPLMPKIMNKIDMAQLVVQWFSNINDCNRWSSSRDIGTERKKRREQVLQCSGCFFDNFIAQGATPNNRARCNCANSSFGRARWLLEYLSD